MKTEETKDGTAKPYAIKRLESGGVEIQLSDMRTMKDVMSLAKELIAPTLQAMLEAEMTEHVGYEKYEVKGRNSGNSRNGYSEKTLKTSFGPAPLSIPRDRSGTFEPIAVRKYETIDNDVEERIISMYAKGMTTRDIERHMQDLYGVEVSAGMVSTITDKVMPLVVEWQSRPLSSQYVLIYLDGIHFKVRDTGRIVNKCSYTVLGVNTEGTREILGLWINETEGAKFWLEVLTEIKHRGVEDILIASVDGLTGFSDAIKTVFPNAEVQQCIVHQIRNTVKHIPHKYKEKFCKDLRNVYTAPTEESGLIALEAVKQQWPDYAVYLNSWENKWHELSPMFHYPQEIRKIMYTTNTIENLHRQLRKVTKTTTIFPHEDALKKLLWLAQHDITRRWTMPIHNWGVVIAQFAILYPDRITLS
jgi:transposase-like protein